jgi:hypothetical protein
MIATIFFRHTLGHACGLPAATRTGISRASRGSSLSNFCASMERFHCRCVTERHCPSGFSVKKDRTFAKLGWYTTTVKAL